MTDNKTTPEQLVREWLPDYEERLQEWRYGSDVKLIDRTADSFIRDSFPEALEAFARHVWEQACREQRKVCAIEADIECLDWEKYRVDKASIIDADAPEFKLTEK